MTSSQSRDEEWLAAFLTQELPNARLVASVGCADEHDADEVTADACAAFVSAFRDGRLDADPDPQRYLLRAVREAAVELRRERPRSVVVDTRAEPAGLTPEQHIEDVVDRDAMKRAFARLTERFRTTLRLVVIEGQTMASAGRLLGLNANAMRQLSHRARARLRRLYAEEMAGNGVELDAAGTEACADRVPMTSS